MYFAEKLVQSGITELNFSSHYTNYYDNNAISSKEIVSFKAIMESPYNINLRRFIDYILFDLYAQGYSSVERTFFKEYMDYLQMQQDFYGKVKEMCIRDRSRSLPGTLTPNGFGRQQMPGSVLKRAEN